MSEGMQVRACVRLCMGVCVWMGTGARARACAWRVQAYLSNMPRYFLINGMIFGEEPLFIKCVFYFL
jgi:hypothetical protein